MARTAGTARETEPNEKRTRSIKVRLTPSEHEEILRRCQAYGYHSLTRYVAAVCTGRDGEGKTATPKTAGGRRGTWERQVETVTGEIGRTIEKYNRLYESAVTISDGIVDENARGRFALRIARLYTVTGKLLDEYRALRTLLDSSFANKKQSH